MKKQNNNVKPVGVWMDHSQAFLIEVGRKPDKLFSVKAPLKPRRVIGEESTGTRLGNYRATNNEYSKHRQQEDVAHAYYKKLADALKPYDEVFLFGPTTARKEFRNYILKEKLLTGVKITSRPADYLSDNQMAEKVNKFFKD